MIHWLKDGQGDFHEQPVKFYANHELWSPTGHVDDEPGSRKIYQLTLDEFHARKRQGTVPELLAELRRLKVRSEGASPAVKSSDESSGAEWWRHHVKFESEPGVEIGGMLYIPTSSGRNRSCWVGGDKMSSWIPSTASVRNGRQGRTSCAGIEPRKSVGKGSAHT
jgi:hypothetical protein